jgi:ribonuclease P protein component
MLPSLYRLPLTIRTLPAATERTPFFTMKVFRSDLPHPRFGFIVSKKVSPHAVTRNRVKRRLRSHIESLLPKFAPGYDILFIVQKHAVEAETDQLAQALTQSLTKKALLQ